MKTISTFLLLLLCNLTLAQSVILQRSDSRTKGLVAELDKQYRTSADERIETPYSIHTNFRNASIGLLPAEKMASASILGTLYINASGKVDYFIFSIGNEIYRVANDKTSKESQVINFDSLAPIFADGIKSHIDSIVSRRTIGRKAVLNLFVTLQPAKTVTRVPQDSVVYDVISARKITDTLKVKELSFGQSLLTAIPDVIYRFPNLERVFLTNNDIEEVDIDMSKLPRLEQLDLSGNILKTDHIKLSKNKSLKLLNLLKNQITDIPASIRNCKRLETLWLGNNAISELSNKSFKRAKMIRDLNLYKAGIAVIPKGIKKMKKLEVLDLYYNTLTELPASICKLKRLTHLAISHNQITKLPEKINKLKRVHTLYAHHNHLSKLPVNIVKMQELRIIDLGYNWFTNFPQELTSFVNLEELDLSSNNFPEFPEQLLKINKLDKLYLRGNPFLSEQDKVETRYGQQLGLLKSRNIEVFY